jgi:hypothetical protein
MPVVNLTVHFSPDEIRMLRRIAETAKDRRMGGRITPLAEEFGMERNKFIDFVMRLYPLRLAQGGTNESFHVTPLLVESIHALDNQPPVDQWERVKTWFYSRKWSIPVVVVVIGVPILVGWRTALKTILEWFGIVK